MPIKFITKNKKFAQIMKKQSCYEVIMRNIEDYKPKKDRKTFYVSPANSIGWVDGGIDEVLAEMFPGLGAIVEKKYRKLGKQNQKGYYYLPVGSSIIIKLKKNIYLVSAPTMLVPEFVEKTQNAYFSTMAILYNILENCKENIKDVDILFTSMCCGCGNMKPKKSVNQILKGIKNYKNYKPESISKKHKLVLHEPNLIEQPEYINRGKYSLF